uniref:Uncharacterized protein n=1 Tax=Anguilla anguilla TaxID=7936 RepID=A0A0E9UT26_ANGAN
MFLQLSYSIGVIAVWDCNWNSSKYVSIKLHLCFAINKEIQTLSTLRYNEFVLLST